MILNLLNLNDSQKEFKIEAFPEETILNDYLIEILEFSTKGSQLVKVNLPGVSSYSNAAEICKNIKKYFAKSKPWKL